MARLLQLFFATLALISFAATAPAPAPAPHPHSLVERSFKASVAGRHHLSGVEEVARTHRKYRKYWNIAIIGSTEDTTSAAAPTPTSPSYGSRAPSTTPSAIPAPPTYGNSTVTSTTANASPTAGSEDGSVSANPEDSAESSYLSPVTIGGQQLNLDFDTGSSDLWVYGVGSTSDHTAFDPSKSSTWQQLDGATWVIQYGDGSGAKGFAGTDVVDIGGSTVQKQAVEVAQKVTSSFAADDELDGLVGLAFSSINNVQPKKQLTFFDNVKTELTLPLFTADLEESTGKGTYDFGKIEQSKYTGDIHYTPVDSSEGFWQITTPQIVIDEQARDCSNCSVAIVDTGTSLLFLDDDVVTEYYSKVPGAQAIAKYQYLWTYPCSNAKNLPGLGIGIGDWVAHIDGADINYAPWTEGSSVCIGGLQSNAQIGMSILGDIFLKQFFVVFDGGEMRVGVASQN